MKATPPAGDGSDSAFYCFVEHALAILYERKAELNRTISSLQRMPREGVPNSRLDLSGRHTHSSRCSLHRNR